MVHPTYNCLRFYKDAQKSLFADFDDEEMNFTDSIKIDNTKIERKSLFSNLKLSQSFNDMDASGFVYASYYEKSATYLVYYLL